MKQCGIEMTNCYNKTKQVVNKITQFVNKNSVEIGLGTLFISGLPDGRYNEQDKSTLFPNRGVEVFAQNMLTTGPIIAKDMNKKTISLAVLSAYLATGLNQLIDSGITGPQSPIYNLLKNHPDIINLFETISYYPQDIGYGIGILLMLKFVIDLCKNRGGIRTDTVRLAKILLNTTLTGMALLLTKAIPSYRPNKFLTDKCIAQTPNTNFISGHSLAAGVGIVGLNHIISNLIECCGCLDVMPKEILTVTLQILSTMTMIIAGPGGRVIGECHTLAAAISGLVIGIFTAINLINLIVTQTNQTTNQLEEPLINNEPEDNNETNLQNDMSLNITDQVD